MKSGPDWPYWKDLNHNLITQRLNKKQSEIGGRFEDLRKHIQSSNNPEPGSVANQILLAHQSLTEELIPACYDIHCEVAADLGYEKSSDFARTLYRLALLPLIRELSRRDDNWCHLMAALPGRQGELKPLLEIASTCASNREIAWEERIEAEATELEHSENVNRLVLERQATQQNARLHSGAIKAKRPPQTFSSTAKQAATDQESDAEVTGRRRARLVAKLIKELNTLRPLMLVPEDDFPKLSKQNPNYQVFKICEKNPIASKWVKLLPDRRRVESLAWELAAVECGRRAATIKTAWKRYKNKIPKRNR